MRTHELGFVDARWAACVIWCETQCCCLYMSVLFLLFLAGLRRAYAASFINVLSIVGCVCLWRSFPRERYTMATNSPLVIQEVCMKVVCARVCICVLCTSVCAGVIWKYKRLMCMDIVVMTYVFCRHITRYFFLFICLFSTFFHLFLSRSSYVFCT
jgi:hypothetical protein